MRIAIVNTGGTISCVGQPLKPLSAAAFARAANALLAAPLANLPPAYVLHYVTDLRFPNTASGSLDSTDLQPSDWCLLGDYVLQHYHEFDAWVILHGTDTLAATATALSGLLSVVSESGRVQVGLSCPVLITGAQHPLFIQTAIGELQLNPQGDAWGNFCGALLAVQNAPAAVSVYSHGEVLQGCRVVKMSSVVEAVFASPNAAPLGHYRAGHIAWVTQPSARAASSLAQPAGLQLARQQLQGIAVNLDANPVSLFTAWAASPTYLAQALAAMLASGCKGLVLASYGAGNFPSGQPDAPSVGAVYAVLKAAVAAGVVVVNCTQVAHGGVNSQAYAAGAWLADLGVVDGGDLTPTAALVKLQLLLALAAQRSWDTATVCTLMQCNLWGERTEVAACVV